MTGDEVEVEVEIDAEPCVVVEPADFARAPGRRSGRPQRLHRLSDGRKREYVLPIERAKKAETRLQRIEKALASLRNQESAGGAARASTPGES